MSRLLILIALTFAPVTTIAAPPPSPEALRPIIDGQISAFRAHDAEGAFRFVDPDLQLKFGTADRFMQTVRVGYAPVYNPQSYRYGPTVELDASTVGQWLYVVGPDGQRVNALYMMEQQGDGSWKTSGCLLFEPGPVGPSV